MQFKDYLIVALAPLPVLVIPLVGNAVSPEWKWTWHDFVVAWVILAGTAFAYRLLATRRHANFTYRLAAGLAIAAGFLLTWINLAVQVIGDNNPGNLLYFVVVLAGLVGVVLSRSQPANLARLAFALAAALFLVPIVALRLWPEDFSPGPAKVLLLNFAFVAMFATSGVLFRHAARQPTLATS
ncbi:MAG TPA: hypothetical protein VG936_03470 [Lacunisphaera sp.]|nr:hypothetical protein [Lacunisphaera sp.]